MTRSHVEMCNSLRIHDVRLPSPKAVFFLLLDLANTPMSFARICHPVLR